MIFRSRAVSGTSGFIAYSMICISGANDFLNLELSHLRCSSDGVRFMGLRRYFSRTKASANVASTVKPGGSFGPADSNQRVDYRHARKANVLTLGMNVVSVSTLKTTAGMTDVKNQAAIE